MRSMTFKFLRCWDDEESLRSQQTNKKLCRYKSKVLVTVIWPLFVAKRECMHAIIVFAAIILLLFTFHCWSFDSSHPLYSMKYQRLFRGAIWYEGRSCTALVSREEERDLLWLMFISSSDSTWCSVVFIFAYLTHLAI